ncbi:MAG: prepilin-type N-terminal cleavage/methylation domain-containing protein [Candidatus Omnitrophica bacterium]|nr:prepilin-type N-terminal cleavage/methylation domain-containing protein [Candidatus Omnitrophota bacterium]
MKKVFTLIELIVVIAIIAILAAIIAPNAFKAIEKAKVSEAIGDFKAYKTAAYSLYADTGKWVMEGAGIESTPAGVCCFLFLESDNNDLSVDLTGWVGWDGPYIEKIKSEHPWGGWYAFQSWDAGRGPEVDMWVDFEDDCYQIPKDWGNGGCPVPLKAQLKIDSMVDDGDLTNGSILDGPSTNQVEGDLSWILVWDAL